MFLLDPKIVVTGLVLLLIVLCYKYQETKQSFIQGMWYNEKEKIYIYIGEKKKNGRVGGYIVEDKDKDVNEVFEMDIIIGITNGININTYKTKNLPKNMEGTIDISKGCIKLPIKNNKNIVLYKDTYTSANI